MAVRLVSYNICFGGQGRESPIAEVLLHIQADIVVLQEATNPATVERLAHALRMPFWVAHERYSLALLSHLPIMYHRWYPARWLKHPFLEAVIGAFPLRVLGVHLQPYFSRWSEQKRVREVKFLLEVSSKCKEFPHLLVGDFNAIAPGDAVKIEQMPAWIRLLIWLSGKRIQREAIKTLLQSGFVDSFRWLHPDQDGFTLPTPTPHVRLDYMFLPPALSKHLRECSVIKTAIALKASDHYPLLAVLDI